MSRIIMTEVCTYREYTFYDRKKDSAWYELTRLDLLSAFFEKEKVPDFKQRIAKQVNFDKVCSECYFLYINLLMIYNWASGLELEENQEILETCCHLTFHCFKGIYDMWLSDCLEGKFKCFLNGEQFKLFKKITNTIVNFLNFYKLSVPEYCCESFHAEFMPKLAVCLYRRHKHKEAGHHDVDVTTKFIDLPACILKSISKPASINKPAS